MPPLRRIALALLSLCAWTTLAEAQTTPKALVYCPIGLDTSGCENVVAALSAPGSAFTGGVDRGYDGSGGTLDLATANLAGYAVVVVPSLADDPQTRPYARLRDATVAAHLRAALTGRRAVWSGTPDLGTANPAEKTALLQNLAGWAAGGSGTGLVALLDNSDDVALRYDWLPGVAGLAVAADTSLASYAAVQSLTAAGAAIVTAGGQSLAYGNMAAFGIHAGAGSAASEDVRGLAEDGSAGSPVLVTSAGSAPAPSTAAQPAPSGLRALVYCPVSLDSRGCDNVIAALTASGTSFTGGVDRGYDGVGGTVDLRTADLAPYGVFIIPSLADDEQAQPYAMLRDPAVAGRLKPILQGPVAVWSGTPDLGVSSQDKKNILIMNLARWAAGARLTAGQQGLVAFQDASDAEPARYNWLSQISRASVTADTSLDLYSNVQALTPTAVSLLNDGNGLQLGYTNMASFGLFPGAGLGADATGGRTASVVLATSASAGGAGGTIATVTTDKEDYQPGDTITVTGAGWQPGETVTLLFHEEVSPPVHPDKVLTAVADASGRIFNRQYEVEESDLGVRFTLTATGQASGRVAQTTFTDNRSITAATVGGGSSVSVVVGQAITASVTVATTTGSGGGENWFSTSWQYATSSPGSSFSSPCADTPDHATVGTFTEAFATTAPTVPGTYNAYFLAWRTAGCSNNQSNLFTLTNAVTVSKGNSTTSVASSAGTTVFGQTVTFTATVAAAAPASGNPSGSVDFKDGATTIGTGSLSCAATCTAVLSTSNLSVAASPHSITAVYAGNASFNGSTSPAISQTVDKANTTTTATSPGTVAFGQAFTFTASVVATSPGSGTPTGTVQFQVDGSNVGSPVTLVGGSATSPSVGGLAVGNHNLSAVYSGDPNFNGSTSANATQTVGKANTTTVITADTPDPSNSGQPVTVNFAVTPVAPGSGTPAGNVTVSATGGTETCTGTVAAGSCVITLTTSGSRTLTANYAGDANFLGSTSAGAAHTVNAAASTLAVDPASGSFGSTAALSAKLTAASSGDPVPNKSVSFTLNGTSAGTATTNASGVATIPAASLGSINAGTYPTGVAASFAGDAAFGPSSGTAALTVTPKATTLTITVGTPSVAFGGTATFSAKLSESLSGRTITFSIDGTPVATGPTNPSGNTGNVSVNLASFPAIGAGPHTVTASFAGETNYGASSASGNFTITSGSATVTLSNLAQTYDATPKPVTVTTSPAGLSTTVTYNGSATVPTNAGSYAVVATVTDANYQGTASGTLVIGPATVVGHFTADNKPYDGTTAATILTRTVTGTLGGDVVTLNGGTATFADKSVGTAKTVTGTGFTLGGPAGGNYVLAATTLTTTANITPRTLTVTATAASRPYDGTTAAAVTLHDDRVSGDVFTVTYTSASFADKQVGTAKTVTVNGLALSGADAGNYQLASTTIATTADITPAELVPHITADNKAYDGSTTATILTRTLSGILGTDVVTLTGGTATFADKNVGTGKTVTASGFTLAGADGGNYALNPAMATATANITPRPLTITADGQDKVYDATVNAVVTLHDDRIAGDALTVTYASAEFADKNVGNAKPVSVSGIAVGGADGGNYHLANTTASTTANITPAALAQRMPASNKEYDGNATATILTRTLSGVLLTDGVSLTAGTASFADKHVGNGKAVTGTGFTLAGADAGNYQLFPMTATTTADITPRMLVVTATGQNKVYDGNTSATVMLHDDRIAGDNLALTYTTATFADKNVANGKAVTVSGIAIGGGADAGNYHLGNTSATTTADITPAAVAPVITASSKEYDGTTDATIASRALTGVISPDVVTLTGGAASFADKDVGTAKTVTGTSFILAGADAANYKLDPLTTTTTADITPRPITVAAQAKTKEYGEADPPLTYLVTVGSLVTGDAFTGSLTRTAGETVLGGPYAIQQGTLTAGGNYDLSYVGANLTITPAPLTVTADDASKVYGDAVPAPLTGKIVGKKFSDAITASYTAYVATGGLVLVGPTTPVSGSPYPIIPTVSAPAGVLANYTVTPVNGNLTVAPATPVYTASPLTVIFGTATTTISGNLAYAGQGAGGQTVFPGGSVQVTFKGTTVPASVNGSGAFSATFNTATVDVTGNPYPVSFNYAAGQDQNFTAATGGTTLTIVDQTAPVTSNILANPNPVPAGTATTLTGQVSDAGTGSSTIKQFEYSTNGGTSWTAVPLPGTSITQPVSITLNLATGVYNLCLRGTDNANNTSAAQCTLVAVYDASAGFVTGGGWINSPTGAYIANPALTGKANFGFVSKYQKGATVPTGDTEFQFQTAGLNFKSTSYEWLVISGSFKAQYKGTGTLNGQPGYNFILTAIDGSQQGGGKVGDMFRIKITGPNGGLVYDNQLNAPDTADPTTILGGGSIVIHK